MTDSHPPLASCPRCLLQTKTWDDKCRSESETVTWMIANTKPCPKCSVRETDTDRRGVVIQTSASSV